MGNKDHRGRCEIGHFRVRQLIVSGNSRLAPGDIFGVRPLCLGKLEPEWAYGLSKYQRSGHIEDPN